LKSLQGSHGHPNGLCHWAQDFHTKVGDYGQSYYHAHVIFGTMQAHHMFPIRDLQLGQPFQYLHKNIDEFAINMLVLFT
jgi:hypothetical protein